MKVAMPLPGMEESVTPQRLESWVDVFEELIRDTAGLPTTETSEYYRLLDYHFWKSLPPLRAAVRAIMDCDEEEKGLEILASMLSDPKIDMPAPETIARARRKAIKRLVEAGFMSKPSDSVQARAPKFRETSSKKSPSLLFRFGRALSSYSPDAEWRQIEIELSNGFKIRPDLVSMPLRSVIFVDTWAEHGRRDRFSQDRKIDRMLIEDGWAPFRFSASELSSAGGIDRAVQEFPSLRKGKLLGIIQGPQESTDE